MANPLNLDDWPQECEFCSAGVPQVLGDHYGQWYAVCTSCLIGVTMVRLSPEQFLRAKSNGGDVNRFYLHDDFLRLGHWRGPATQDLSWEMKGGGMLKQIDCLDKGYVRLVTWLPQDMVSLYEALQAQDLQTALGLLDQDDLNSVNAAKASYERSSKTIGPREHKLVAFLANHGHASPFRHAIVKLEIKAPMMVARQWFKYRVGSIHTPDSSELLGLDFGQGDDGGFDDPVYARNESSRRYVTSEPEFYCPEVWRSSPSGGKKQGSAGNLYTETSGIFHQLLERRQQQGQEDYSVALEAGVTPEMARLFLHGYGLYLYWQWMASLGAVCHFLNQRLGEDAQAEITEYAQAVHQLVNQPAVYPLSVTALVNQHD